MICPIGLECLADCCPNQHYCNSLMVAWPLPYQIWEIDSWHPKKAFVVTLPAYTGAEAYDEWAFYIRSEMREVGWEDAINLPYDWNDGALVVTNVHILNRQECRDPEEGFAPAVKLDNWRVNWKPTRLQLWEMTGLSALELEFDQWGFYLADGVPGLAWRWNED